MGRYRGTGLRREEWYSICSHHREFDAACRLCQLGNWHNVIWQRIDSVFYKASPWGWQWWANRRNSTERKFLQQMFPKLKGK